MAAALYDGGVRVFEFVCNFVSGCREFLERLPGKFCQGLVNIAVEFQKEAVIYYRIYFRKKALSLLSESDVLQLTLCEFCAFQEKLVKDIAFAGNIEA